MTTAHVGARVQGPAGADLELLPLLDATGEALLVLGPDGRPAFASPGAARLLGRDTEDLLAGSGLEWWLCAAAEQPWGDLTPGLTTGAPHGAWLVEAASAQPLRLDVEATAAGARLLLDVRVAPLAAGAVLVLRDVTEERRAAREARETIARQDAVIAASPDTIFRVNLTSAVVEWSNAGPVSVLGMPPEDAPGAAEIVHEEDAPALARAVGQLRTAPDAGIVECTYRISAGMDWRWIHARSTVSDRDVEGRPVSAVGIAQDMTETINAMDALAASERRFHEVFARGPVGMLLYGLDGYINEVNDALCAFLQRDRAELVGAPAAELVDPVVQLGDEGQPLTDADEEALRAAAADFQALLDGSADVVRRERRFPMPDGNVAWGALHISATTTSDGQLAFLAFVEDITVRKREEEELIRAAMHDALTGLPNRAGAEERLGNALTRTRRRGGGVAVLFVDLDRFKEVNDTLGHQAGDDLLRDVADRLTGVLRAGDTAARLGGDEFIVVCEEITAPLALAAFATRVCDALQIPVDLGDKGEILVTGSVGAAMTDGSLDAEELLQAADKAMYRAKAAGRACWRAA
ncbi:PAS domain S-box-containing protein/diguanylate cyclase (GGDEF)-like protein [Kineococcus xinjiangensis]|uniref:PAS domain S-box-containing protein/diguanylate cyclase (GGDEF)-like protein n=1 Tax=Kineococcus xinjiangensis TaxID=512762 RepID=A0A2S6IK29_9ACTN|nr:diguanylate cyclase [Kineococcus xinjiangensis]PPK94536.1 PAS domain S-box-containing protein/diguanylate cyclase (GGDEF)-like protein [Kineococcus xinjiangensis]